MSSSDTFVDRISSFVSGNKRGIAIGAAAAAVAIGGVAYYVASSRAGSGAGDEESLREGKKKDKKRKKHRKSAKDKEGPILEERKPKVTEEPEDGMCAPTPFCFLVWLVPSSRVARSMTFFFRAPDQPLTEEQIQALSTEVSMSSLCRRRLGVKFSAWGAHPDYRSASRSRRR
jgi:hypothetical protein